jgi:hypothetical protein
MAGFSLPGALEFSPWQAMKVATNAAARKREADLPGMHSASSYLSVAPSI